MDKPIMNIDELDYMDFGNAGKFACKLGLISRRIGGQQLGYNLTVVAAGKRAFPLHNHRTNEEMFFVIEGKGELRMGDQRHAIGQGDVIACPAGGPELAHQIINTSDAELKYLAVSTTRSPEVVQYPDSDKTGVTIELEDNPETGLPNMWRLMVRMQDTAVDYWDGED